MEYIPQGVFSKIKDKSVTHNKFRIQSEDSVICGFYCTAFIEYVIAGKNLLDDATLFSLKDYRKNGKTIY